MKKYLCLGYYDPVKFDALPAADRAALVRQCPAKDAELRATGRLVASGSLDGPAATRAAAAGWAPQLTDGPYAEAKELVGGFFIVEAETREEAIRLASLHPAATLGEQVGWGLEVHPVGRWLDGTRA